MYLKSINLPQSIVFYFNNSHKNAGKNYYTVLFKENNSYYLL